MAEVTAFRNNALPDPVYGVPWVATFPILDADGDPETGVTCDSEVSKNGDTGVDCTNEGTEIPYTTAGNKGMYYLILTAAEMTADVVDVVVGVDSGKPTCLAFHPRKLVTLASGTSQGGAVGYITLAAATVAFDGQYNGCLCVATIDGNVEARVLQACTTADQQCTVTPNWNVAPDADDTYVIYLPEGRQIPQANVTAWNSVDLGTTNPLPNAAPGASTGLLISGSNTGTTTFGALTVTGGTTLTGAVSLGSTLGVTGAVTLSSTLATGAVTLDALTVTNLTTLTGNVLLSGTTTFTGAVTLSSTLTTGAVTFASVAVTGVLSAGTNSLPWNSSWDTEVESEVTDALVALNLDHLMKTATGSADMTNEVPDGTVLSRILSNGDTSGFIPSTDGLQLIRDAITAGGPVTYALDSSSTINTGSAGSGSTYADAQTAGGNDWEIEDENGDSGAIHSATSDYTIDQICEFNMGAGRIATELDIRGYYNRSGGGGYVVEVYGYNYTTSAWVKLSVGTAATELRDRNSNDDYVFALDAGYTDLVTTPGEVKIGLVSTRQTTQGGDVLYLDYVRVSGEPTGGVTPAAIAAAVHTELDEHLEHLTLFTGEVWYVAKTGGADGNSGHTPTEAFETIGAAIAAAAAGDYIKVKAGTYVETGINMNLAGLELHGEIGAVIDPASGSALTVSAEHCLINMIEVRPAAGEIGFDVASGSDYSEFANCIQSLTGGTGIKIDSATSDIKITNMHLSGYTSIGVEINGPECVLDHVFASGIGGSETGFKLNHTNAHHNVLTDCYSIDNATSSFHVIVGADDNLFESCADSDGCGADVDAGANNTWRDFEQADVAPANVTELDGSGIQQAGGYAKVKDAGGNDVANVDTRLPQ